MFQKVILKILFIIMVEKEYHYPADDNKYRVMISSLELQ